MASVDRCIRVHCRACGEAHDLSELALFPDAGVTEVVVAVRGPLGDEHAIRVRRPPERPPGPARLGPLAPFEP